MDTKRNERQELREDEIAQLIEAQARGEQSDELLGLTEVDVPQANELDVRVSKYGGPNKSCNGDGR